MKQANAKLRPDGRWEARAVINGKRQSFYGERQQDAIKAMRAAQKAADDGIYTEPTRFTLAKWLDVWISEYVQPSCKPLTVSTYRNRINVHIKPKLGQIKLSELTPTQIQQFYNKLTRKEELSPKTVKNIHGILHKCLAQAVKIVTAALHELGKLFQLRAADRRLHIRGFEVVAKMRIHVFMVVANGQFPVLAVKAMLTQIIHARRANAISAPVAHRTDDLM